MKTINTYINERLHITSKIQYSCHPKTKDKLQEIIIKRIKKDGPDCYLNDIDVSKITDMSHLFNANRYHINGHEIFKNFNGDISLWDVSNVTNMCCMFKECEQFNCDISKWNVSNVTDMEEMFDNCEHFNCDISKWDVSSVKNMRLMFYGCKTFNCRLSRWNVSNVKHMGWMFGGCKNFRQNLDNWDVSNVENMFNDIFNDCPTQPKWYKEK